MSVEAYIRQTATRYGVPPDLAVQLARRESGLRQDARGRAGEIGIMQLMPGTARELGVDPYDWRQNIEGGIRYLRQQYDRFGSWDLAVAAYNAGPGAVASGQIPASTLYYMQNIVGSETPTFSVDVYSRPIMFPLWVLGLGLAALIWRSRRD